MITSSVIASWQPVPDYGGVIVAGVDEAGRGCLAGPVTAAAVMFPETADLNAYCDSKQLTPARREYLAQKIYSEAVCWAVAHSDVCEIDRYNILRATLLAMKRAVARLSVRPELVLTDGNQQPDYPMSCWAIVRGDARVPLIGAASIVAKHERDTLMVRLHKQYPHYGFKQHKGYGTAYHRRMLAIYGRCAEHRLSFKLRNP